MPFQIYRRLERNELLVKEKVRTGQVIPPIERGLEEDGPVDIQEIIAMLSQGCDVVGNKHEAEEENNEDGDHDADINSTTKIIYKISLSKIFTLNKGPDVTDIEKL